MHVSLIVPAPFDTVSGGYEYDRRIVEGLRAHGHLVDIIALPGSFPLTDETARDAACSAWDRLLPGTRPVIDGLALPAFTGMDDALVARGAFGLIHHPTALETGLDEQARESLRAIEQRLMSRMTRVIVTSEPTAACLTAEFGLDQRRIRVVVPGTDDAPRCTGSGGPTCQVLSVGTLIPRKGHDLLLRALARLFDLDWHLTLVGSPDPDPVHARGLSGLAETLGITSRVTFTGALTAEGLEPIWRHTDLFALATHFEGYGMAVAEALKRGIPVAVTAGGAVSSLVEMEAGVVCPVGDLDQFSKSLRRMIFSRALRQDMADMAWQSGQALPSWDTQAVLFGSAIA